jgi:hypothetical protein
MNSLGQRMEEMDKIRRSKGQDPTFSVRLTNGQSYMIQVKHYGDDFIHAKVHNSWTRYIAIAAIAEFWDVSESEAHAFKDIEPKGE